jgi:plastocyanin
MKLNAALFAAAALVLAACGKETTPGAATPAGDASASSSAPAATAAAPPATGKVIVITMITDEKGNRFEPNKIEAHRGDVLRFTLGAGVHNVDFLADKNPGATGLPPASEFLQLPGQTKDIPVTFAKGHYYFQCDPHSALGMTGDLEVED